MWSSVATANDVPAGAEDWSEDLVGLDGFSMPATQHDLWLWTAGGAYGGVTDHGTVFVGFNFDQWRMAEMLRRMAGVGDGIRCALTRYLTPLTGAYYVAASVEVLAGFADPTPAD